MGKKVPFHIAKKAYAVALYVTLSHVETILKGVKHVYILYSIHLAIFDPFNLKIISLACYRLNSEVVTELITGLYNALKPNMQRRKFFEDRVKEKVLSNKFVHPSLVTCPSVCLIDIHIYKHRRISYSYSKSIPVPKLSLLLLFTLLKRQAFPSAEGLHRYSGRDNSARRRQAISYSYVFGNEW